MNIKNFGLGSTHQLPNIPIYNKDKIIKKTKSDIKLEDYEELKDVAETTNLKNKN